VEQTSSGGELNFLPYYRHNKSYSITRRLYTSKNWFQALVFPRLKGCSSLVTSDLCRNPLSTCSSFTLWWPSVCTCRDISTYLANSGFRISIFGRGSSQALVVINYTICDVQQKQQWRYHKYDLNLQWLTGFLRNSSLKAAYCALFFASSCSHSERSLGR
jgi:hypothetical protein